MFYHRTYENDRLQTVFYDHWVSGFFPVVFYGFFMRIVKIIQFREYAELYTARVEPAKKMRIHMILVLCFIVVLDKGYRLTKNPHYLNVIKEGSENLLTRWNPKLGVIKSWERKQWQYPVIIDNMMNLEMLCFMTREFSDRTYVKIAETHAQTTLKNHFRTDYSTYHVVSYDTITGIPHTKRTAQGYADYSSWARGQAWGLYGYTMMYRETLNPNLLRAGSSKIGKFSCFTSAFTRR